MRSPDREKTQGAGSRAALLCTRTLAWGCPSDDQEAKELGRRLPGSSLPAGVPPDSVARGGGAGRAVLTGSPSGGHCAMAGAEGLMDEVSWKVLERRARAKRSGLAACDNNLVPAGYSGWCASSSPLAGGRWDRLWGDQLVSPSCFQKAIGGPGCALILGPPVLHSPYPALPAFRKLRCFSPHPQVISSPKLAAS